MNLNEIKLLNEVNKLTKEFEKTVNDIYKKCVDCSQTTVANTCQKCPLFHYFIQLSTHPQI